MKNNRQLLTTIFNAAIKAVSGQSGVYKACLALTDFMPDQIIAIGKAAGSMALGALAVYPGVPVLVVTKHGHGHAALENNPAVMLMTSGHPVADADSLLAGKVLLDTVAGLAADSRLLLLVSGGASALAESLPAEFSLAQWQTLTGRWLADGLNIGEINRRRKQISLIKDGRLLQHFTGREVITLAISDVQGDDISVIGSGIGDSKRLAPQVKHRLELIASNQTARHAAEQAALEQGYPVIINAENLYAEVFAVSEKIARLLCPSRDGTPPARGIYLFGGEPTITLPRHPGNGGRNQSLALALGKAIAGNDQVSVLVAGTDGTDGPTDAAGAIVDGDTFSKAPGAQQALEQANAGAYLRQTGDILITGPTGTNVMDLVIALVWQA